MNELIDRAANIFGYWVVPSRRSHSFLSARFLARLFLYLDVDLVLDVGANVGQYHDFLRQSVRYRGPVVSFEPTPDLVAMLKQRAPADPNWRIDGRALGEKRGTTKFNVMENSEFSSFREPRHDDVSIFSKLNKVREIVEVEMVDLNSVVESYRHEFKAKSVYLKLDTQGYDLAILKGGVESLANIAALQTEVAVRKIYSDTTSFQSVIDFLQQQKFVMSGIFPSNEGHFPILIDFDCHMIRSDLIRRAP